jgi:hypothetical protein
MPREPSPGENVHVMDKSGRWWRLSDDKTFEEAFRRPRGTPLGLGRLLVVLLWGYAQFFLWMAGLLACGGLLWALSSVVAAVGVPGWLGAVSGVVAYLLILRFGRRRGWF